IPLPPASALLPSTTLFRSVGLAAGIDHLLSFFGVDGHRLFTDDVFTCACYANRLVFVKAIRCDDVDGVYILVVFDLIEVLVVVAVGCRYPILLLPVVNL